MRQEIIEQAYEGCVECLVPLHGSLDILVLTRSHLVKMKHIDDIERSVSY
jgi:hypothetical protein